MSPENHIAATHCIWAYRHQVSQVRIRMGKKGDFSVSEHGMVIDTRQTGLSISEIADLLGTQPPLGFTVNGLKNGEKNEWAVLWVKMPCRVQGRMTVLLFADRQ